jgi:EAL domain-containing protein (putative c-di-GMP-specific phosphodiesterase class I)
VKDLTLLDRILEPDGLSVVFQPIFRLLDDGWHLYALEALMRGPSGTNMEAADVLFEYVRRKREESMLDRECIARALESAKELTRAPMFSLNVHASTLGRDHGFVAFLEQAARKNGVEPSRLTIEIIEHSPYWDGPSFVKALEGLRETGVRIALDDVGLGHSNYRMILECRPDYFKIDRYLVKDAGTDFYRQAVLRSIANLAESFGAWTVAEGVDNLVDLGAVIAVGLGLVQGYLLSPPLTVTELQGSDVLSGVPLTVAVRGDEDSAPSLMVVA